MSNPTPQQDPADSANSQWLGRTYPVLFDGLPQELDVYLEHFNRNGSDTARTEDTKNMKKQVITIKVNRTEEIPDDALEVWFLDRSHLKVCFCHRIGYAMSIAAGVEMARRFGEGSFQIASMNGDLQYPFTIRPSTEDIEKC